MSEIPNLLTYLTFLPLAGMLVLLFIPKSSDGLLKGFTLLVTLVTFVLSLPLAFDEVFATSAGMQYVEKVQWIKIGDFFQMNYHIGIDGISLWLVLLTQSCRPGEPLIRRARVSWRCCCCSKPVCSARLYPLTCSCSTSSGS